MESKKYINQTDLESLQDGLLNLNLNKDKEKNEPVLVNNLTLCKEVTQKLLQTTILAIDLEGVDLSRNGEVCLINITDRENIWLFDVCELGASCFEEGGLKEVFSSSKIIKIIYDGRSDCDALFHLYGIEIKKVVDLQVMYTMKNRKFIKFLPGMARAIEKFLTSDEHVELEKVKSQGKLLFAPEKGGSYDVWKKRPLSEALIKYCSIDLKYLFRIYDKYSPSMNVENVIKTSESRIKEIIELKTLWARGPKSQWTKISF